MRGIWDWRLNMSFVSSFFKRISHVVVNRKINVWRRRSKRAFAPRPMAKRTNGQADQLHKQFNPLKNVILFPRGAFSSIKKKRGTKISERRHWNELKPFFSRTIFRNACNESAEMRERKALRVFHTFPFTNYRLSLFSVWPFHFQVTENY